jgi:hypothetical protein
MSYGPKSYFHALVLLLASLVLSTASATANVLSLTDYENFHNFSLKMRPIADDLAALLINPPMPGGRLEAATTAQNCIIRVIGNFDPFAARLDTILTLVGLAARMAENGDELLVIGLLSIEARSFLQGMKFQRQMLDATKGYCSQDGATVAKIQEISRIHNDADSLVAMIVKKIGAKPN